MDEQRFQKPRFRRFLESHLHAGTTKGFQWMPGSRTMFIVSWHHQANSEWNKETSEIFKEWALHTGKHTEGDPEEYATWKTRFRTSMNKANYIRRRPELCKKGRLCEHKYNVYEFVNEGGTGEQPIGMHTPIIKNEQTQDELTTSDTEKQRNSEDTVPCTPSMICTDDEDTMSANSSDDENGDQPQNSPLNTRNLQMDAPLTVRDVTHDVVSSSSDVHKTLRSDADDTEVEVVGEDMLTADQIKQEPGSKPTESSSSSCVMVDATTVTQSRTPILSTMLDKEMPTVVPTVAPMVVNSTMPGQAAIQKLADVLKKKAAKSKQAAADNQPPCSKSNQMVYLVPSLQNSLPASAANILLTNSTNLVQSTPAAIPNPNISPSPTPSSSLLLKPSVDMNAMKAGKDTSLVALTSNVSSASNPSRTVCGLVHNSQHPDGTRKEFLCNFCQFKVGSYATFNIHLAGHIFKCRHCSYKAFTRYEMITHRQEQHPHFRHELSGYEGVKLGEGPNSVFTASAASNCQSSAAASSKGGDFTYKIHEYNGHDKMYECCICLYMTHELYNMYDHATMHKIDDMGHGDTSATTAGWGCYFCSFSCNRHPDMISHIKSQHAGKPLKLRHLTQKVQPSSATPNTTMWGCYYCPDMQTETRENAVLHVQECHRGQKLMITRRRIVPALPKDMDTGPELRLQIENTRSLSQIGGSRSGKRSYSDMISFLNDSNKVICEQLKKASKHKASSENLQLSHATASEKPSYAAESEKITHATESESLPSVVPENEDNVESKLSGFAYVIYDPVLCEVPVDIDKYMTVDRLLQKAVCTECGHTRIGKHATSHMREHVMLHTGERIWGCSYCEYVCNRRMGMYNHVRVRHPTDPVSIVRRKPYARGAPPRIQIVAGIKYEHLYKNTRRRPSRLRGPRSVCEARILRDATHLYYCNYCTRSSVFQEEITEHMKYAHPASKLKAALIDNRPPLSEQLKEAVLQLVRLEDMRRYHRLRKLLGPGLASDEAPALPNSTESGKYQCPYCSYRTVRPLIVKQHILCRHPDDEVLVTDLRATPKRSMKTLYLCALPKCEFVTAVKHALYAHLEKNPVHAGVQTGETKSVTDSDRPLSKISLRCSSLRSANSDPLVDVMKEELSSGLPSSGLLLKCCYCDMSATYDCVVMKQHLTSEHVLFDPVVIDVRAQLQQLSHRLLICPVDICDPQCYTDSDFAQHVMQVHPEICVGRTALRKKRLKRKPYKHGNILQINTVGKKLNNRYCCCSCRYRGATLDQVRKHLVEKHANIKFPLRCRDRRAQKGKIYFCRSCPFFTRALHDFESHVCEVVYQCSSCTCKLLTQSSIEEHVLRDHGCQTGGYSQTHVPCSGAIDGAMEPCGPIADAMEAYGPINDTMEPQGTINDAMEPHGTIDDVMEPRGPIDDVLETDGLEGRTTAVEFSDTQSQIQNIADETQSNVNLQQLNSEPNDNNEFSLPNSELMLDISDSDDGSIACTTESMLDKSNIADENVRAVISDRLNSEVLDKSLPGSEMESEMESDKESVSRNKSHSETESGFEGHSRSVNEKQRENVGVDDDCLRDAAIGSTNNVAQAESVKITDVNGSSEDEDDEVMSNSKDQLKIHDVASKIDQCERQNSNDTDSSIYDSTQISFDTDTPMGKEQAAPNRDGTAVESVGSNHENNDESETQCRGVALVANESNALKWSESEHSVGNSPIAESPNVNPETACCSYMEESSMETDNRKPTQTDSSSDQSDSDEDSSNSSDSNSGQSDSSDSN